MILSSKVCHLNRSIRPPSPDDLFSANFGRPTVFVDPRRAMVSVRVNLGR
jgi:hypothetical protein